MLSPLGGGGGRVGGGGKGVWVRDGKGSAVLKERDMAPSFMVLGICQTNHRAELHFECWYCLS